LDSGAGSFRQAILNSNGSRDATNSIEFVIDSGAQTIRPTSPLPTVTRPVVIDGTSQPGYAGTPLIELDGSLAGAANGLKITAGGCTIQGLVINRFGQDGIQIQAGGGNTIQGDYLGTDLTGTTALGNGLGLEIDSDGNWVANNLISGNRVDGVRALAPGGNSNVLLGNLIGTDATGTMSLAPANANNGVVITGAWNTVGGTDAGAGNLISGNHQQGIYVNGAGATNNVIQGNYIGTDATGMVEVSNGLRGITVANGASDNLIGGPDIGAGNLLSGNLQNGLELTGDGTTGNLVQGNLIGTDATGGAALPNHLRGVGISYGASGNTVGGTAPGARNIISGNLQNGVLLDAGTDGNVVQGNFLGTDITGTYAVPNHLQGVLLGKTSIAGPITNNLVGGTEPGAGNLIAGNLGEGVRIQDDQTSGNLVQGNLIGTNVTGYVALPNGSQGVLILQGAFANTVGGTDPGAGNLIAGNAKEGILIRDAGTEGNVIQGNQIGTDVTGSAPLGNAHDGVHIMGASNNSVGATDLGGGNTIAFNGGDGVLVESGTGNAIRANAIFANAGPGIELRANGNSNQAAPVLESAVSDGMTITIAGAFHSAAATDFTLEFFATPVCSSSGSGEGENFLGTVAVTTDAGGDADFTVAFDAVVDPGEVITATATDPGNNTSAFSACLTVTGPGAPGASLLEFGTGRVPQLTDGCLAGSLRRRAGAGGRTQVEPVDGSAPGAYATSRFTGERLFVQAIERFTATSTYVVSPRLKPRVLDLDFGKEDSHDNPFQSFHDEPFRFLFA
jgi:titin